MTVYDPSPADRRPFNLGTWIRDHRDELTPPVANRQIWREADMIVMIVGGGNQRCDFHDDPREEFFYQIQGDMNLVIWPGDGTEPYAMPIREGDVYLLPGGVRHSPQRPDPASIGLVVEYQRNPGELDGFEWVCFDCAHLVHRVEVQLQAIDKDLPPLFDSFHADEEARTCPNCGALHPGTNGRL
ncbi:MAG: 3-hydroxyanthranilate 3,4-dioxygenase [Actinobacteria bacterium]|nr:3-hydroxyanthranilate 3,4-dioxygenase [Actinomycetota bacterium]